MDNKFRDKMGKLVNIITVLFFMIAGIDAQGSAFRRFMFMRDRELAFRRAFPFGTPLTFRGTGFPASFAARMALARRGGSRPISGSPFATGPVFFPGSFEGPRFGTVPPFGTGDPTFFPEGSGFPPGSGFPTGSGFGGPMPPTGSGFPSTPDISGSTGSQPTTDSGSGMTTTDQSGSTGGSTDMGTTGSGPTFPGSGASVPDLTPRPDGGMGAGMGSGMGAGMGSGMGAGMGTGMGAGMGTGMGGGMGTGMGGGMGTGMGAGMATGMGAGMGTGMGAGMGTGMGAGMGTGMGPSPFPTGFGAPGGFGGFGPMPSTPTGFGPGFRRPVSGSFPGDSAARLPEGRVDSSAPNGRFQGAPGGFRGFGQSDRPTSGFVPPTTGPVTGDRTFFGRGPAFDVTPSFPGRSTFMTPFPGDPRFAAFGQSGRFPAPGPQFTTPGASTDPNLNLRFQPLPGSQPSGQFGGVSGTNQFPPMTPDMRNPTPNTNTINTNNNQMPPSGTGSQAASIDGFGAVSSTNNLNTDPSNMVSSNTNTNPSGIIRFDAGTSASQPEVVVSNAGNQAGGSNEFRVVEVGNILDTPTGSGSITVPSTDQSVVDSMGFQAGGDTNMAARDLTATTVVTEGNQSNAGSDTLSLSSPLNQDFSFFVPSENTNSASGPQGATFSVESPPPPPIMVPDNNNNQQPGTDSSVPSINDLFENTGFVAEKVSGTQTLTFPIVGTKNKSRLQTTTNSGYDVVKENSTEVTEEVTKPGNYIPKTTMTTTTRAPLDIANSML